MFARIEPVHVRYITFRELFNEKKNTKARQDTKTGAYREKEGT